MMKRRLFVKALALALASASLFGYGAYPFAADGCPVTVQAKEQQADAKVSMQSVQAFGYELLGQYLKEKNPVMSPVSAYVMLGMAAQGAKGTTKKEFQKVLGSDVLSVSRGLMEMLPQKKDGMQLTLVNSAWMDDEFTPKKNWLETAQKQFEAEVFEEKLDTNAAKNKINAWVNDNTGGMIPKLLEKKLEKEARLALVNALYFQADWQQQFRGEATFEADFKLDDGKMEKADMMKAVINECGYFKDGSSEGVVLPIQTANLLL